MKELIEAGYVYIAQPPLYKLRVGNDDRYFEKEHQLEEWLIRERLDKVAVNDRNGDPVRLTEARLQRFTRAVKEYEGWAGKLREQYGAVAVNFLKDHELIESEVETLDALEAQFVGGFEDGTHRVAIVGRVPEGLQVTISERTTGASQRVLFSDDLLTSVAFRNLRAARRRLVESAGLPPFGLAMGKHEAHAPTFEDLRPQLLELAKEGLRLQRFKGLGEMNPAQLRETTMAPEGRVLQQVGVDDAASADQMFSVLMGDRVEPRRAFIERNAHDVKFLDV